VRKVSVTKHTEDVLKDAKKRYNLKNYTEAMDKVAAVYEAAVVGIKPEFAASIKRALKEGKKGKRYHTAKEMMDDIRDDV
jgi:pyrroline-5-carboxylate reductase